MQYSHISSQVTRYTFVELFTTGDPAKLRFDPQCTQCYCVTSLDKDRLFEHVVEVPTTL